MKFWDSSALVALHVKEERTRAVREVYARDAEVVAWVLADVEIHSALARLAREGAMSSVEVNEVAARSKLLWRSVAQVAAVEPVKRRAKRLLMTHALRAADALQLGAALTAAQDDPLGLELVCLDERLSDAARREGFSVLPRAGGR